MRQIKHLITKMASSVLSKSKKMNRPFTVAVEGNIGSGKTTFLEYFKDYKEVCILGEPVQAWRNINGHNLLGLMYEDPNKWSFTFQSYVQLTMLQNHLKSTNTSIKLMERSIFSARYCFVEKLSRDGVLSQPSVSVIDQWFQWIKSNKDVSVDLVVYLRTSPKVAYQRILDRKRPEEAAVSFSYIQSLHQIHEDWLYDKTLHKCPAPVLVLNADLNRIEIEREYKRSEMTILTREQLGAYSF